MLLKQIIKSSNLISHITRRNYSNLKCIKNKYLLPTSINISLPTCSFHTSGFRKKFFVEQENIYAYKIINKRIPEPVITSPSKEVTTVEDFDSILNQEWRLSNASDIVNTFKNVKKFCLEHNIDVSDSRFDKLVDGLCDHCEKLTDAELVDLLTTLTEYPLTPDFNSHNFHDIWSCLDDICCWKIYTWDADTRIQFARLFYKLNLGKPSDYIFQTISRLCRNAKLLTKDQLVQIFFLINVCRRYKIEFEYEDALAQKIHEMDVDEMAVVALGYFKAESKVKLLPIINAMIQRVIESSKTVHEISLTAILKCIRHASPIKLTSEINKMLDALIPEMDRLSNICCLHISLIGSTMQIYHEASIKKVAEKLVKNIHDTKEVRVKDIERLLHVLTMFDCDPKTNPDVFEECFKEIQSPNREKEFIRYPRCLISALNYFSIKGMYSYDLMNKVLDNEFILEEYGKAPKVLPRDLHALNNSIDIECPDYKGNRLSPRFKYKGVKWHVTYMPEPDRKLSQQMQNLHDVITSVKEVVKDEKLMVVDHILPHFAVPDVVLCRDKTTGKFIEPPGFENYILGDIKFPNQDKNLEWISIISLGPSYTVRNSELPLGIIKMKVRQTEKIGYIPKLASWYVMLRLKPEEKVRYISSLIS